MKTKVIFISVVFTAICMQLNAQNQVEQSQLKSVINPENAVQEESVATIVFDKQIHDFGTIQESDGKASFFFTFTNQSDSPLVISRVVVSCGCSAAEWTKEPVAPGEQGYVKATYDPVNRIGSFNKTLTVYSNGNPPKIVLSIRGTVVR